MSASIPKPPDAPSAPERAEGAEGAEGAVTEAPVVHARVRRAPRFGRFGGTGVLVGLVLAVVLTFVGSTPSGGRGVLFGFLTVTLTLLGGIVGAVVAVIADRRSG